MSRCLQFFKCEFITDNLYVMWLVTVYTINCIWNFIPVGPVPVCGAYCVKVWREWYVNTETYRSVIRNRYC